MTDLNKPRIAVLFPGALGDFVCLIPALHALAETAQLQVFAKTEFADIVPRDIAVGTLERYEINRLFVAGGAFERRVRDFFSPYERIYSWMGSGLPVFAGELGAVAAGRARLFAFRAANSTSHQADYYLSCLGFPQNHCGAVNVPLRPVALKWREEFWDRYALMEKAVLVLAPGSGAREKNWPAVYFAAVARWWRGRTGGAVIVLVGPAEQERGGLDALAVDSPSPNCSQLAGRMKARRTLRSLGEGGRNGFEELRKDTSERCSEELHFISARNLNLAQVAALLCRADLYLGNDSGITHLAAAVGAPTVALFGPSDARRWAPRGPKVRLLSLDVACSPCDLNVMKSCPHRKCLTEFLPDKVIGELEHHAEIITLTWGEAGITVQSGSQTDQIKENAG